MLSRAEGADCVARGCDPAGRDDRGLASAPVRERTWAQSAPGAAQCAPGGAAQVHPSPGGAWQDHGELAAIVSSLDDGIISAGLDGTVRSWNAGAEALLGWSALEMIGRPMTDVVPANRRAELDSLLSRVRAGLAVPTRDTRRLHRDGHEVDVALSVSLIQDSRGEATGFAVLVRDITERKLAEREQRRLLAEATRRERWLSAISEVRLAILGGGALDDWLELLVRQASDLSGATGAAVLLPEDSSGGGLSVRTTRGLAAGESHQHGLPTLAAAVFRTGRARSSAGSALGPQLAVPLATSTGIGGVLAVVRQPGERPFDAEDIRMVEGFSEQAALALELARAREDRQQLALVADRERIARDLHDHVIQRLFAVGMSLQAVTGTLEDGPVLERIDRAVDDLDATIRQVRSAIFSLEVQAQHNDATIRARILRVASEASAALGFSPRLQFNGPIDTKVPPELVPDVLAVIRECLSNAARHAEASAAEVAVSVDEDLLVAVSDNGRGLVESDRSSGLANLRSRAQQHEGDLALTEVPGGGLLVRWRVPLPA